MDEGAEKENILVRLIQIKSLAFDTQQLRMKLIQSLQELFETASRWAKGDSDAMKLAGYIAQVLNNLAKSYDERRFNDDLKELERLMQQAKGLKQKLEEGGGVEIRPSKT
jgi:pyruvate carboxylase